jgi:predicted AAA+ superfamily ATPase
LQRLVKSPKIHCLDPIFTTVSFAIPNTLDALDRANLSGFLYESWIYTEIIKCIEYESHFVEVSTWHTQDDAEVDMILTQGLEHIPLEIKYKRTLNARDASGIKAWMVKHAAQTPVAYIIYCGDQVVQLDEKIWGIPDHYFLGCS